MTVEKPPLFARVPIAARHQLQISPLRHWLISMRHRSLMSGDVFLASYPKSGNTWLRHLLAYIVTGKSTPWRGGIDQVSDLIGRHHSLPPVAEDGGRLIKTHEPFRKHYRRAVVLIRDGRDVAVSEYHFQRTYSKHFYRYNDSFATFFDLFLKGKTNGYRSWHRHVTSWLDASESSHHDILHLPFETLRSDPHGSLRRVVEHIGLTADDALLSAAIEDSGVESMKRKEREHWEAQGQPNRNFVRGGKSGNWREYFTPEMEERFWSVAGSAMTRLGYERQRIENL